jgi:hypothetical protein
MLGQQQNMPKRKEMKTLVSRRSDEDPQPLRPLTIPTTLEALQSDQSQPTPSRRETPSTWRCCPD